MATLYKRGKIWWAAGFDRHGVRWQRSTKQRDERIAGQVAAKLEEELAADAHRPAHKAEYTIADAFGELVEYAALRGRSAETIEFLQTKAKHVVRILGDGESKPSVRCAAITPAVTSAYAQARIREGAHRHTVHKEIRVLKQALRRAAKLQKYRTEYEIRDLRPDEVDDPYTPRDRWLPPSEYALLLAELDPSRDGRTRRRRVKPSTITTSDDVVRLGRLEGREHWSEDTARTVLLAWASSGDPMRTFARAHGFAVQRILWWRERLGMQDELETLRERAREKDRGDLEADRRDYIIVCCQTGARLKELYGVRAEHVNLAQRTLFIAGTKNKKARRTVPITGVVVEVLQRRISEFGHEPLFPVWDKVQRDLYAACLRIERKLNPQPKREGRGPNMNPQGNPMPKRERVRPTIVFDPVTPNDLRRTYASWLAQAGVPILHAVKLMGHGSMQMLERVYAQLAHEHLQDAVAMLPAEVTGVASARAPRQLGAGPSSREGDLEAEVARLRAELAAARGDQVIDTVVEP